MKIDLSAKILDLDGSTIRTGARGEKDFTLGSAVCTALLTPDPKESDISAEEKLRRFNLATKLYDGGVQDLSVEDISLLKLLIGRAYPALTVGRCFALLDPVG